MLLDIIQFLPSSLYPGQRGFDSGHSFSSVMGIKLTLESDENDSIMYGRSLRVWYFAAVACAIGCFFGCFHITSPDRPFFPSAADRRTLGYGTPEARSYRNLEKRSVVTDFSHPDFRKIQFRVFFAISLALFFSIPTSCLRQILDVDRRRFPASGISETRWRKFLQTRLEDWSQSNLLVR